MACSLIFVDEAFVGQSVYHWHGDFVGRRGGLPVSFFDLSHDPFKVSPEHRTITCIVQAIFFRLSCALFCRCNVGQNCTPDGGLVKARNYADLEAICQSLSAIWYSPRRVYKYPFKQQDRDIIWSDSPQRQSSLKKRLFKSTLIVSSMTTISRVFGLIRDVVIATVFGPGIGVDAFIVAFRIPNFLRRLFAEGGFSQAFVPILSEYKEQRSHDEVKALVDQTTATLSLVLFVVTIVGVLAAPVLVYVFAPGFAKEPDKQLLAVDMLRLTFPYILFISLTALAGGILNTYRHFAVPAFTPVLLNLTMISSAIWLAPHLPQPVVALAWAVLVAGIVQLFFQFPFLLRLRLFPIPGFNRDKEGVRRILKLMLPTLFAVSITQINLLIDTLIASFLATGSISWLYFSDRLVEFPLGVFGIALATVILPSLSEQHANGQQQGYSATMDWALRLVFLIAIPAALGLAVLAEPMLTTLFQYKEFGAYDVSMAGRSLMAYSLGLPAFILIKVLLTGFYSRQDTKTPVKIGVVAMLSNVVLNLLLVIPLAHAGLALATSLSAFVNAGLLYFYLHKRGDYEPGGGWTVYLIRLAVAVVIMALVLRFLVPGLDTWLDWNVYQRLLNLLLWVVLGAICYFVSLLLLGIRPKQMTAPH
jgi:putative peptidoglycan lipid II flippase